jgi:glycine hydroxymethyltransferase
VTEFKQVGDLITQVLDGLALKPSDNSKVEKEVRREVGNICARFPIYDEFLA